MQQLNLNQFLWIMLKSRVCAIKPTNLTELYEFYQEDWSEIQKELRHKFVDDDKKCLVDIQLARDL